MPTLPDAGRLGGGPPRGPRRAQSTTGSGTVSKLRTSDLRVLPVVRTNRHPIGIAYDVHRGAGYVWVACNTGTIMVFKDS